MKIINKKYSGFTLIELTVVITIIGIMAMISIYGLPAISKKGQDTQRLAQFRELQLAIEGYKNINGRYPNAGNQGNDDNYIHDLTPGYIKKLPVDSVQDGATGFKYKVTTDTDKKSYCLFVVGTVYKPEGQPDLESTCSNSWQACNGNEVELISDCSFDSE